MNDDQKKEKGPERVMNEEDVKKIVQKLGDNIVVYAITVEGYSARKRQSKKMAIVSSLLLAFFVITLSFDFDIGMHRGWEAAWMVGCFFLAVMFMREYIAARSWMSYWESEIDEETKYLQDLKKHLAKT